MSIHCNLTNRSYLKLILSAACVVLLYGCAGTDFVRQGAESISLGKTTQAEIMKKMGKPYRSGTIDKNGKSFPFHAYSYANTTGEPLYKGVVPARTQSFTFDKDVLVGNEFIRSFKADGTDFDETKVAQIEKGKSTKANVIQVFGQPGGEYIYPLVAKENERALVYQFMQAKGNAFNMRFYQKSLIVTYDASEVISNVEYTASGTKE